MTALFRTHTPQMYAVAFTILANRADAEDALQESWLRICQVFDRYDPARDFARWCLRITANQARDLRRRRTHRVTAPLDEAHAAACQGLSWDPAEIREFRQQLADAVLTLPVRQRVVFVLHDVQGVLHADIADVLQIPIGTARADLHHARRRLRHALRSWRDEKIGCYN
jgi:RNA polymerase sigma-70 factor (ECF subfamily)